MKRGMWLPATRVTAACALVVGLIVSGCSMEPGGGTPVSPSTLGSGSLLGLSGGDSCPAGGLKIDQQGGGTFTSTDGQVITQVCIKAGNSDGIVLTANGSNGCYTVQGLNTTTVTVSGGGTSRTCQTISHFRVYLGEKPPPPQEICGDKIDNDGDGLIDEDCPPPPQEICGDKIDNDGDGLIDEDCAPPQEICGDKIDNDGDGKIDEDCKP